MQSHSAMDRFDTTSVSRVVTIMVRKSLSPHLSPGGKEEKEILNSRRDDNDTTFDCCI